MNSLRLNRAMRGATWRRVAVSGAAVLLATVVLVLGCGGGGGGGGGSPGTGGLSGAFYYSRLTSAIRFDLGTRAEISVTLASSTARLGYGGGMFTDVTETIVNSAGQYRINLRDVTPNPFALKKTLPAFTFSSGHVEGPVQPSPNGTLFAMHTRESAGISEPILDYVYVFDAALNITFKRAGYRDPAWLANDRLVVGADDGVYTMTVAASPTIARLGQPGTATKRPTVSPDGRTVAYLQSDIVWRIGVDGSGLTQLTVAKIDADWPAWSPDGSQIVMVSGSCGGIFDPPLVIISATAANQDLINQAATVLRDNGQPVLACAPVYWLP